MRATVKDVAALASVSPKTVSNVINSTAYVRPETRQRVEEALAALEYIPNFNARGLRNGRSGLIALALPDLTTSYSAEMTHHFIASAREYGWGVQIEETGSKPDREFQLLSRARSRIVDGLILNPTVEGELKIDADTSKTPPTVLIGEVQYSNLDRVTLDSTQAAYDMTARLLALGHRRVAIVGSSEVTNTSTALLRTSGYRQAVADLGGVVDPALELACDDWTSEGGAKTIAAFLESTSTLPDAFFCFTDTLAMGALSMLYAHGIKVPRDVSVAGYDDIALGRYSHPSLTTVSFSKEDFAHATLARLKARIDDPGLPSETTVLPHRIVERASTRAQ